MKMTLGTCMVSLLCVVGCSNSSETRDVTGQVRTALGEADLVAVTVDQDADRRVVTLRGNVLTAAQKANAELIARREAPGQTVINEIGVAAADAGAPDPWLTMKTKVALMTTDGVSTSDLNVDTVEGVVTLHGKVSTDAEKARAETVAAGIDGVREVKNLLQVVAGARRDVVERADGVIRSGVESAFSANRRINDSGIKVASVNQGVVLLSGKTESMEAYLESVEVADAVRGVRRVSTEVEVTSDPRGEASMATRPPGR